MTPEEILEERNKIAEFKKKFAEYPLTSDECFKGIDLKKIYELRYYSEACSTDGPINFIDVAILAMRDACDQTVDLCGSTSRNKYIAGESGYLDRESIQILKKQIK